MAKKEEKKFGEFDINAPIERQYLRNGNKVVELIKLASDLQLCLCIVTKNSIGVHEFLRTSEKGIFLGSGVKSQYDLVTELIPPKEIGRHYRNIYPNSMGQSYGKKESAIQNVTAGKAVCVVESIFYNDGKVKSKIVHKY